MERRSAIKNIMIIAGGIAILPACSGNKEKASIQLNNLDVSADQESVLAEIAETIIPATNTPGGKALNLHLYVLKMVDDCHDKAEQEKFFLGLIQLDELSKKLFGETFINATNVQRTVVLQDVETKSDEVSAITVFYKIMKSRTIQGYLNSKHVMTELIPYELVPGRYNGYFPVKNI